MKRTALALVVAAAGALAAAGANATPISAYQPEVWNTSGPVSVSINPATGPTSTIQFQYNDQNYQYQVSTWSFTTTATSDGPISFNFDYNFLHSWFQATATLDFRNFTTGEDQSLYNGYGQGDITGIATVNASVGDVFGFVVSGSNYDYSRIVLGTITLSDGEAVPEPASVAVFGSALLGLAALRRRQRSN